MKNTVSYDSGGWRVRKDTTHHYANDVRRPIETRLAACVLLKAPSRGG